MTFERKTIFMFRLGYSKMFCNHFICIFNMETKIYV